MTSPHEQALAAAGNRIWFDTEFIEDGRTIDLISIGMVRDDGATYYAECAEADLSRADDWVKANVIVHLRGGAKPRAVIAREIIEFAGAKPEFWAYYADYDWVALCQLFGRMIDLPKGWPMFCRDLKQWAMDLGNPGLPEQDSAEHHALADAQWNRQAWDFLAAYLAALPAPDLAEWEKAAEGVTPGPWEAQQVERHGEERGCAFIVGAEAQGLIGAALSWPTELDNGDFARTEDNARWFARCSPDNVLSAFRSLSAKLAAVERERDTLTERLAEMEAGR